MSKLTRDVVEANLKKHIKDLTGITEENITNDAIIGKHLMMDAVYVIRLKILLERDLKIKLPDLYFIPDCVTSDADMVGGKTVEQTLQYILDTHTVN